MATLPVGYIPQRKVPSASSSGSLDFIGGCVLSQELYFLVISYSLPGTVLPKKEVKIGEYATSYSLPGTVLLKKEV